MKFKYLKFSRFYFDEEFDDFELVDNPFPYNNLPDGEYMVRGDKKHHRKEYWKFKNKWYLVDDVKKDNGHFIVDLVNYDLLPRLSEKEWDLVKRIGFEKLKPIWKYYYWAYLHRSDMKRMRWEMKKFRKRILK